MDLFYLDIWQLHFFFCNFDSFMSFPYGFAPFQIDNLSTVFHPCVTTAIIYVISNSPHLLMLSPPSPAVTLLTSGW